MPQRSRVVEGDHLNNFSMFFDSWFFTQKGYADNVVPNERSMHKCSESENERETWKSTGKIALTIEFMNWGSVASVVEFRLFRLMLC